MALQTMVVGTPGAVAGVVSDDDGDAIDYAHDPEEIDALDVQLLAAQISQSLFRVDRTATWFGLDAPVLLLETSRYGLVASPVAEAYVVAMLMERRANMGRAFDCFRRGRHTLHALLA
ncbi:MAG: hypothetical protein AAGA54_06480 [Myxococcota bacterium]